MTWSWITHLVQSYGYYAVFTLIALESIGIPLPGETALITAALYAGTTHHLSIVALAAAAAAGAVVGDNIGYWLGRTGGYRLAERYGRFVHLDRAKLKVGRYLFARHGGKVVFFGRFVAVLRAFAALLAGMNGMAWPRFLLFNAAGAVAWAGVYGGGGFWLGAGIERFTRPFALATVALAILGCVVGVAYLRRHEAALQALADADCEAEAGSRAGA
jgi:membrane protein DedA with SNARE-associated domain